MSDRTHGNGLVCFTNCFLVKENGTLASGDLWIDERRGVILDAQRTFYLRQERPDTVIDLGGNILSPGLIDSQINGAYGFDFSIYDKDDRTYSAGLDSVARRIVETGVTSFLPTIITQDAHLYPSLLRLLIPRSPPPNEEHPKGGASILGWHVEGPFLQPAKRGAHALPFLRSGLDGFSALEEVYGKDALAVQEDWALASGLGEIDRGVRLVTLAPEVVSPEIIPDLRKRGVSVAIGHSVASADTAARAVRAGARMVTHLFNAMPQLHHRDPGIIGLLGASDESLAKVTSNIKDKTSAFGGEVEAIGAECAEALDESDTPPRTPTFSPISGDVVMRLDTELNVQEDVTQSEANKSPGRPYYGMIVDGVHSHPNSVRLAYTAHMEGCVLITDAMSKLDPTLPDGPHPWRDGRRVVKEGVRLYIEGTDTLAGSVVTLDTCVRNFKSFTGCSLAESIRCATFNPAKCLGIEMKKGTLRAGADADLVVFDHKGVVLSTWVRGNKVWERHL